MKMLVTPVFAKLKAIYESFEYRQIVLMGGTRSSKSWSILQLFIYILLSRSKVLITVWRNTRVDCRDTVRADFRNILVTDDFLYNSFTENKTEGYFQSKSTGSRIVFGGADDIGKVLGKAQTISFFNEVTEFSENVYLQIVQRTTETIFADYNPSKNFWFERMRKDSRTIFDHSTYKDNPFLSQGIIDQILSYDPNNPKNVEAETANAYMHDVYALGIQAEKPNKIYHGWKEMPEEFFDKIPADSYFALDFGLASPNALVEIKFDGKNTFYVRELLYVSSHDLKYSLAETIDKAFPKIRQNESLLIADSAKKSAVEDLIMHGYAAVGAIKGAGSVESGIQFLQSCKVVFTAGSNNFRTEYDLYSYEMAKSIQLDRPERNQADHLLDAFRYGATYLKRLFGVTV